MGKLRVVSPCVASSLIRGDGGLLFHFILSMIAVLDKINGKPRSLFPKIRDEKIVCFFPLCGFILDLVVGGQGGSDGGLLFHFILPEIADKMMTDNIKVD